MEFYRTAIILYRLVFSFRLSLLQHKGGRLLFGNLPP
ncbi:hypothetical protein EVA_00823 [gut metagenome]|uniref:Uncharacterized protein n=1 Tax=gut metagenome TaxID=749906 RepID=J9GQL6_9ZZZZ